MSIITKQKIWCLALSILGASTMNAQALSGNYTINPSAPAGNTNFQSFSAAAAALSTNGVNAAVTFQASAGIFNEQVLINTIAGTSATNTVTFQGNETTISYTSSNTGNRAIVKLKGADHIRLVNLDIISNGNADNEYGYGIQLADGADSNAVIGCKIYTSETSNSTANFNYTGILISQTEDTVVLYTTPKGLGNPNCNYNTFQGNTITGGHYGIALMGNGLISSITGNKILNNTIKNFYRTGIFLNGTINTTIDGNDIARPNRPNTPFYQFFGIHLDGANSGLIVSKNKIHDPFGANYNASSSGSFGIYINASVGNPAAPNLFSNNIIYNLKSNGIAEGVDITNSNENKFIHNTIDIDDSISTAFGQTRGFSLTGVTSVTIVNNIIRIKRANPGTKHAIYAGTGTAGEINNNDYYLAGSSSAYVGYLGSNYTTLAAWQTGSGFDNNSLSIDPQYANIWTANFTPQNALLQSGMSTANTGVNDDVNTQNRNTITPTLGAVEMNVVLPVHMSLLHAKLSARNTAILSWSTYSETSNRGFEIEFSNDGKHWSTEDFVNTTAVDGNSKNIITYEFNSMQQLHSNTYYRLKQVDINGSEIYSNIVLLNLAPATGPTTSIYPNPAKESIILKVDNTTATEGTFLLFDAMGRLQLEHNIKTAMTSLSISSLPTGNYYYQFMNNGSVINSGKLSKQ